MNSSGIKRGLASSAIAALAVTGLPFLASSASAQPLTAELGNAATKLYSPVDTASTKNDGVNSTVHLLAGGGADIKQVRFDYQVGSAAAQAIATVSRVNDAFST